MAQTQEAAPQVGAVYSLQGTLTEACSCNVPARAGSARTPTAGSASPSSPGTSTADRSLASTCPGAVLGIAHIPGNILAGNWELVLLVDEHTTPNSVTRWSRSSAASSAARWPTSPS